MKRTTQTYLKRLLRDRKASVSTVSAIAMIPMAIGVGVAVDLGRTIKVKTQVQAALDSAVLSGVRTVQANRDGFATSMFDSQGKSPGATVNAPAFATNPDRSYSGAVNVSVPTSILKLVGRDKVDLLVKARAAAPVEDNSCIFSLGHGMTTATDSMTFNGASATDLSGCTLRSNSAMKCNGHTGNADASYSAGAAPGCANPYPNSAPIPDIHAGLANNVVRQCGMNANTLEWTAGGPPPSSPQMMTTVTNGVTYYHVCGSLTLKGTGTLLGNAAADSVLVVENGDLTIAKDADITLTRTTLILTGETGDHRLRYPNGNGQSATLRLSPSQDPANPWQGTGIYQDPTVTGAVDIGWGPGANLFADGVLYFGKANVTISGNATSNGANCTKLVVNTLTSNGAVDFKQNDIGCNGIGIKQFKQAPYLIN